MFSLQKENLYCPISKCIFADPVLAKDGFTYERQEIEKHFEKSNKSPMTNKEINDKTLIDNNILRSIIAEALIANPDMQYEVYIVNTVLTPDFIKSGKFLDYVKSPRFNIKSILSPDLIQAITDTDMEFIIENSTIETLEAQNQHGNRLIHLLFIYRSSLNLLSFLIHRGVDVNAENNEKRCPIHILCGYRNMNPNGVDLLKLLIGKEVNLEAGNYDGLRPAHLLLKLIDTDYKFECLKILIDNEVDMEAKENTGHRPIHYFCDNQYKNNFDSNLVKSVVTYLVSKDIDFKEPDGENKLPIYYILKKCSLDNISYYLDLLVDEFDERIVDYLLERDDAIKLVIKYTIKYLKPESSSNKRQKV